MVPLDFLKIPLVVNVIYIRIKKITSSNNVKIANIILCVSLNVSSELTIASNNMN